MTERYEELPATGGDVEATMQDLDLPLPRLRRPIPPAEIEGVPLNDIFLTIREIRRQVDKPENYQDLLQLLISDPQMLRAVSTVLNQSELLLRPADGSLQSAEGTVSSEYCPLPQCPPPPFPPGINSWVHHPEAQRYREEIAARKEQQQFMAAANLQMQYSY